MKLASDWKNILRRAWSVRFMALLIVLSGIEGALGFFTTAAAPLWLHIATPVVGALALLSRIVAQSDLPSFFTDEQGAARRRVVVSSAVVAAVMAATLPVVQKWEGLRTEAYRDVVGVWTVCYGETEGVSPGDRYTAAECSDMLEPRLIENYYLPLVQCAPTLPDAPAEVQAAFTSWTYNVGTGAACRSTLIRKFNAGDIKGACNELPRWNRAGGRVWQGLTNRRADERGLCLSGVR